MGFGHKKSDWDAMTENLQRLAKDNASLREQLGRAKDLFWEVTPLSFKVGTIDEPFAFEGFWQREVVKGK